VGLHTSRGYSVRRQVLASTSLVTHSAAHSSLHSFTINNVFYKLPEEKKLEVSNLVNKGAWEWVSLFLFDSEGTPCAEKYEPDGKNGAMHHLTVKLFPQGDDTQAVFFILFFFRHLSQCATYL
jgi:hypothetical protein